MNAYAPDPHQVCLHLDAPAEGDVVKLLDAFLGALSHMRGGPPLEQVRLPTLEDPAGQVRFLITVEAGYVNAVYRLAMGPTEDWTRRELEGVAKLHDALRRRNVRGTVANGLGEFPIEVPPMRQPQVRRELGWWVAQTTRVGGSKVPKAELKFLEEELGVVDCEISELLTSPHDIARELGRRLYETIEVFGVAEFSDDRVSNFVIERVEPYTTHEPAGADLPARLAAALAGRSIDTSLLRAEHEDGEG